MKLPDNEPLEPEDYWTVQDTWKQEWEKGVQVPVKPDGLPEPAVILVANPPTRERFALPRKLICMNASGSYTAETHQVINIVIEAILLYFDKFGFFSEEQKLKTIQIR